jgi:hypothetical protein
VPLLQRAAGQLLSSPAGRMTPIIPDWRQSILDVVAWLERLGPTGDPIRFVEQRSELITELKRIARAPTVRRAQ